jgi:hypothetical protein
MDKKILIRKNIGVVFILDNLVSRPAIPPFRHKYGG